MPAGDVDVGARGARPRRAVAIVLLVGAIGPLIGMLGVLLTVATISAVENGDFGHIVMAPLLMFTPFTLYTYMFGGPPALVTGLALAVIDRRAPNLWVQSSVAAIIGALASLIWQPIITASSPANGLPIFLPIVGAGSAIVCAVLVRAILRRA